MKQTNFQLFDFLDFVTALTGEDVLWKACAPVSIQTDGTDVLLEIPFQKQKVANYIAATGNLAGKIISSGCICSGLRREKRTLPPGSGFVGRPGRG